MIKACTFFRRKEGLSFEQYQEHWRSVHVGFVRRLPGIVRYVQSHPIAEVDPAKRSYDGLAEAWFENSAALRAAAATDAYAAIVADEEKFIDRTTLELVLTEEHVVKGGVPSPNAIKYIELVKRKAGMSVDDFQEYWLGTHGELASKIPGLERYVQSHTRKSAYASDREPKWDGLASMWFRSLAELRASPGTEAFKAVREDGLKLARDVGSRYLVTKEMVMIGSPQDWLAGGQRSS